MKTKIDTIKIDCTKKFFVTLFCVFPYKSNALIVINELYLFSIARMTNLISVTCSNDNGDIYLSINRMNKNRMNKNRICKNRICKNRTNRNRMNINRVYQKQKIVTLCYLFVYFRINPIP